MTLATLTDKERAELLRRVCGLLDMSYDYSSDDELIEAVRKAKDALAR